MRPARRDTRQEILELAETLFHQRGFHGFSYQDIAAELGIKSAAVHYHFPNKADLGIALVQRIRDFLRGSRARFEAGEFGARQGLEAYFEFYAKRLCQERRSMCAVGLLAAELNTVPDTVRAEARGLVDDIRALLTGFLRQGQSDGSLPFFGDPETRAASLMCLIGGAAQYARIADDPDLLDMVIAQARRDLGLDA